MKRIKEISAAAVLAAVLVLSLQLLNLPEVIAQISNRQATPTVFVDYTGTNWVAINASAGLEVRKAGTIYTGGSTNVSLTNLFGLRFVNGVYTGAVPLQ